MLQGGLRGTYEARPCAGRTPGHGSALQGSLNATRSSLVTVFSPRKVIVLGLESRYSGSTILVQYVQDVARITKPVLPQAN